MIQGERIRLWALEKFDISQNYHWANDPELVFLTGMNPNPKSLVDVERWYEMVQNNLNLKMFTIKTLDGDYIGNVEIADIDWRVGKGEIGLFIGDRAFWNQGYGAEALRLMMRFGFENLRLHRIEAMVLDHNPRAMRVFEKCGFSREGVMRGAFLVNGVHHDVVSFSVLATDPWQNLPTSAESEAAKETAR